MHTKESLMGDLRRMGLSPDRVVMAHTSMKAIGMVEGRADGVIDALMGAFPEGLLTMPTLTWTLADKEKPVYDVVHTPTDVGLLPEIFRKRPGVLRSWHPTHSMAAYGHEAKAYVEEDHLCHTPCGLRSSWRKLYEADGTILMIGCGLTSCTFIHGVEEWCGVTGRIGRVIDFTVRIPGGECLTVATAPHIGSPSEQYWKAEVPLREAGALVDGRFGDAPVLALSARKTYQVVAELLKGDPRLFDEENNREDKEEEEEK